MKKVYTASLILLSLFLAVAAMAKAKRYDLQLAQDVQAGSTQLKAGAYQVEVDGNSLVFYQRQKEVAKVTVKSEDLPKKNEATSVTIASGKLIAIQLSGTKSKLTVE